MLFSTRSLPRIALIVFLSIFALQWIYFGKAIPRRKPDDDWNKPSWSQTHDSKAATGDDPIFKVIPSETKPAANPLPSKIEESSKPSHSLLPCASTEGMSDVVYVIKTGANEVDEKLPVHFNTTMRCWPHVLIFADFAEEIDGHTVHDALRDITPEIRLQDSDFELWRRIHEKGRGDLKPEELSTNNKAENPNAGGGQIDNKGWRLDKFKFLPMLGKSLALKPDAKWFIFTDSDTFISWSNMAAWIKKLDPTKSLYLGSPAMIGDQLFAHGGSGFILSRPAVEAAAKVYAEKQKEWDEFTASHWAGDCVIAAEMEKELDLKLTSALPMIQGGDPSVMDWTEKPYSKKLWCFPAISYHHLTPALLEEMFDFEQDWTTSDMGKNGETMRHGDVFQHWLLPKLNKKDWAKWDNRAEDVLQEIPINDVHGCRDICHGNSTCFQYTFGNGTCSTYDKVKLGYAVEDDSFSSGWMIEKIKKFVADFDQCDHTKQNEGAWITH